MAQKILLADDSMTAQNMGKKILTEGGYDVVAVSNGAAAVKKIAEHHPELVILDVYMPGYNGLEVCERLRAALETACARVRAFHAAQLPPSYEQVLPDGGKLRCLTLPLGRAACYVPGGRAAYPSTVCMTVPVAKLAGVREVIVATPPRRDGAILPEVAAAARIAGDRKSVV